MSTGSRKVYEETQLSVVVLAWGVNDITKNAINMFSGHISNIYRGNQKNTTIIKFILNDQQGKVIKFYRTRTDSFHFRFI